MHVYFCLRNKASWLDHRSTQPYPVPTRIYASTAGHLPLSEYFGSGASSLRCKSIHSNAVL